MVVVQTWSVQLQGRAFLTSLTFTVGSRASDSLPPLPQPPTPITGPSQQTLANIRPVRHQVIDVQRSSVNMVPSKVEIVLRKADQVSWGKLEDPNYKPEPEPEDPAEPSESFQPDWDIADDDISDSDEDWAYDTPEYRQKRQERESRKAEREKEEEGQVGAAQNEQRRQVEEELKRAAEERRRAEEERRQQEEQWRREEEGGEYEDMPELE